ncbi:hypothetical protein TSTA_064760 [Talaromyces stipitatus ATCC 10500]|uniref:2EXR domain-containing protein n=1 Tax=Talaromyces stipitatus (strain ATCC 10500 / CBS 375.48 / QM 6759 / NRRL 1006) TaxID=441959 RepID=B8LTD2_TALSN|nr:uncharacterized protein TSTA_064760 [Talaromyces stipitatus ATCC 10500]EED23010.1 hypothetical protein TSTA_064760 [Talaromyces stipitatus ATCC 10500]
METSQTDSSSRNEDTRFHLFPRLPTEIRLEIWRASLPRRIISLDSRNPCPGPSKDFIQIWQRPPSIACVCKEARSVAFQHGRLRWAENVDGPDKRLLETIPEHILADHLLADAKQAKAVVISSSYMNFHHIEETARLLTFLNNPFLYIARNYVVHMSKGEAIDSGLFGFNAEEPIVLVDDKDKDQLRKYAAVCSLTEDNLFPLEDHLDSLEKSPESEPIHNEFAHGDISRMWLHLQRHGIPAYGKAKGNPRYEGLYNQFGFLNRDHHMVKSARETIPKYRLMFVFELCRNSRHLLIMEHQQNKKAFNSVCQDIFRRKIYTTEQLREYLIDNMLE